MAKAAAVKPLTKTEILNRVAEASEVPKKDVASVLDALSEEIRKSLSKRGPREFTIPGLCKITVKVKPATKARKGVNPFTGEDCVFKAKPASNQVKIRPLKKLKDMV